MLAPAEVPPMVTPAPARLDDRLAERRAGDHRGELELVAAGHEDAGGPVELLDELRVDEAWARSSGRTP